MNIFMIRQPGVWVALTLFLGLSTLMPVNAIAEQSSSGGSDVMGAFHDEADQNIVAKSTTEDEFRHQLLFFMGLLLLIFIFTTAYFGLSMALFGKDVFIQHMISAGATVFLAMAHAVVAVVWFFPF